MARVTHRCAHLVPNASHACFTTQLREIGSDESSRALGEDSEIDVGTDHNKHKGETRLATETIACDKRAIAVCRFPFASFMFLV